MQIGYTHLRCIFTLVQVSDKLRDLADAIDQGRAGEG